MTAKNITVHIGDKIPSLSDQLLSECLSIQAVPSLNLQPNSQVQVNLTVKNSSDAGRMATVYALYDPLQGISVQIQDPKLYVAPGGKTVTFALIEVKMNANGSCNLTFGVS
jgi:hypothetical protein